MIRIVYYSVLLSMLVSCAGKKIPFSPDRKYSPDQLRQDYTIFRNILEESHPSLYWYAPKDSIDYFFNQGYARLGDSLTESQFRTNLLYMISKIDCGHTSVRYSKQYAHFLDTARLKTFPLSMKFWGDTMVATANLNRKDSILRRGTIITSIDGHTPSQLRDSLFNYVVTDGYSATGKYQTLSTGFAFANLFKYIYGLRDSFDLTYMDTMGIEKAIRIPVYNFKNDTMSRWGMVVHRTPSQKKKQKSKGIFFSGGNLSTDTLGGTAFMDLSTFDRGYHLQRFFKKSFRSMRREHVQHLIIDVRSNGGGDAGLSTLLTRYLINRKFKLADSLYAVTRTSAYNKYISKTALYTPLMHIISSKRADGKYHFGYFERHWFKPKTKNHFNGDVYILTGGNSFSATTLFAGELKGQPNVTIVGEETGGGYYGNTAWIIQDVTLPNTKLRFTLPRFRLVVDHNREKNGRGVIPDAWAVPTSEAIRKGIDFKTAKARELIEQKIVKAK